MGLSASTMTWPGSLDSGTGGNRSMFGIGRKLPYKQPYRTDNNLNKNNRQKWNEQIGAQTFKSPLREVIGL